MGLCNFFAFSGGFLRKGCLIIATVFRDMGQETKSDVGNKTGEPDPGKQIRKRIGKRIKEARMKQKGDSGI